LIKTISTRNYLCRYRTNDGSRWECHHSSFTIFNI